MTPSLPNDFDPYIQLNSPEGIELAIGEDISPTNTGAKIEFNIPKNGVYKVIVTSSQPREIGTYQLSGFGENVHLN